ncbi:unnamed protein product [Coregonus sp. 'balchen']|nr:unnamed protein product [Coregonus sp. 'balchen']
MCSTQMILIILIGIATIETVTGFSGGGVEMSCNTMLPQHFHPTPESGFLLEARESQDGPAAGTFTLLNPTHSRLLECNGNPAAAVTQPNNQPKTSIEANWTAPSKGVFYFRMIDCNISAPSTCMLISTLIRPSLLVMSLPKGRTLWHKITLMALVGVAMILSLGQTIIVFLPFGPSHELRSICDLVLRVIAFTTEVFTMAAIFVGLVEIEKCCSIHWRMKVMGGYAAWVALFYLMFIYLYCNQSYQRKRNSGTDDKWIVPNRTISFSDILLKVILVLGNLGFTVALIIGIYTYET